MSVQATQSSGLQAGSGQERIVYRRRARVNGSGRGDDGIVGWKLTEGVNACLRRRKIRSRGAATLAARFSPENIGVRDPGIVSRYGDVEAIFESQFDSVLQSYLQSVVVNQLVDPGRIDQNWFINLNGLIGRD